MEQIDFSVDECNTALREARAFIIMLKKRGKTPAEVGLIIVCAAALLDRMQTASFAVEERAMALARDYITISNMLIEE